MVKTEIIMEALEPFPIPSTRKNAGVELVFNGRVRLNETEHEIVALEYEYYEGMADKELQAVSEEVADKFPIQDIFCRHRVGQVAVGEISIHATIWSRHRNEALCAMTWFISELKKRVPIWKWAILKDGSKYPIQPKNH